MASQKYDYDVLSIGAGSGGCSSIMRSADCGKRVALVEYRRGGTGGTCVCRGCIPTKALLRSAQIYAETKKAADYGIIVDSARPDMKAIQKKKQMAVNMLIFGLDNVMLKSRNVARLTGKARLLDPHTVELTDGDKVQKVTAETIIVATGSEAVRIPAFHIDGTKIMTSDDVLNLTELPESMLVVGAGVVGLELAYLFATLDVKVTVVEMAPHVLPLINDADITDAAFKSLKSDGIEFRLGVGIQEIHVREEDGRIVCTLADGSSIEADLGLAAIGRRTNTAGIGLEEIGVEMGPKGSILVNEKMQTNIPSIYAVGDITAGPQLSHKAQKQGLTAADNICGIPSRMNYDVIPSATFIQPEVATVGLTDSEAQAKGIKTLIGKMPFSANEKAITMRLTRGFVKVVAEKESHKIIGAQIFGPEASSLIEELAEAIENGLKLEDIANSIHTHPTLSELVMETCKSALGLAFHKSK
jgi:dihydrolipoamide dehydrogenase